MKLIEVINTYRFLSGLELSKFDKDTRKAVRKNYVAAQKKVTEFEETQKTFREKCFEGVDDDLKQKATTLEQEFEKASDVRKAEIEKELLSEEFAPYQQAKKEFVELIEEELRKEVEEIEWAKVGEDALMDSFAAAEMKFTASLADELKFMIKD